MLSVTNKTNQKLVVNLTPGDFINLQPKETVLISSENISVQLKNMESKGLIKIKRA